MKNINFMSVLTNFVVILFFLYVIPFIGIVLLIIRLLDIRKKNDKLGLFLVIYGVIICLPTIVNNFISLKSIIDLEVYNYLYSSIKFIIGTGIFFIIVTYLIEKAKKKILSFVGLELQKNYDINKENNLKIKEKQERAKTTHVIICPYCGSDNILNEKIGKCRHCRKKLSKRE